MLFYRFERRLLALESLESSRLTAMPPYARLAFAMNMSQLLQRRAFILNQERAFRGSSHGLVQSGGQREAARLVLWSQTCCQVAPWACLAGLLGTHTYTTPAYYVGRSYNSFAVCFLLVLPLFLPFLRWGACCSQASYLLGSFLRDVS